MNAFERFFAGPPRASHVEKPKLVAFLYVLMRDEATPGVIAKLVQACEGHEGFTFSNPHLEAYARELANRLSL